MILTCPNCATRFGVPEKALQPAGRTVKCSRCAHLWFSAPDGQPAPAPVPATVPRVVPAPAPEPAAPARAALDAPATAGTTDGVAAPSPGLATAADPGEPPRTVEAAPASPEIAKAARTGTRPPPASLGLRRWALPIGWGLFVAVVGALALAIYFHEVLAAEYPATRPFYRVTNLMPQLKHDGLKVQNLSVTPDLGQVDARNLPATVTVGGEVINESWMPRTIRTLQGRMRDAQRQDIQRWSVATPRSWLWPGQAITFRSEVPLEGVRPFEIVIDLGPLE